jgi:hypothetical protein
LADPDVAGRAILTRDDGIEVDCADIALRRVVEIGLKELVQVVGEKRRIGRGCLGVAVVGVVAVERLEQRLRRLVSLRRCRQGCERRDGEGEDECGQALANSPRMSGES